MHQSARCAAAGLQRTWACSKRPSFAEEGEHYHSDSRRTAVALGTRAPPPRPRNASRGVRRTAAVVAGKGLRMRAQV